MKHNYYISIVNGFSLYPLATTRHTPFPTTNAPQFSQIYLDILPDGKAEFDLGTVKVGHLKSYTAAEWTKRMKPLYPDMDDYIEDIILPRAVFFRDGSPTLRDTWTPGSPAIGSFQSTSSTYDSSSITLEQSAFAGVSAKFMGAEATIMVGFEASVSTTFASTQSDGFGVSMTIDGSAGGSIARFRASAYLLPASNDWIQELIHFQSDADKERGIFIEPTSSCWKIMFVVDQISMNSSVEDLELPEEVIASLQAEEIVDTQGLLQRLGLEYPEQLRGNVDWITLPEDVALLEALRKWDAEENIYPEDSLNEPTPLSSGPVQ